LVFIFFVFLVSFQLAIMALTSEAGENQWNPYPTGTFAVAFFTIIGDYSYAMETMNKSYLGVALLAIYAFISQIILVNLLIAMMGSSYDEVKEHSDKDWQFYRYTIVCEYKANSPLPPPFNGMVDLFNFLSNSMRVRRDYPICSRRSGYQRISSSQPAQPRQPAQVGPLEIDKIILKILKISREKILEKDLSNENASFWCIARELKKQLEASEKKHEQQLKDSEKKHEQQLKDSEKKHEQQLKDSEKKHEQQLEASEKKHEQLFAEVLGILNKIDQQLPKNFDTKAEKEE